MIGDIRKSLKTTQVKILIWLALASIGSFAVVGLVSLFSGRPDSIAKINGYDITALEFQRRFGEVQNAINQVRQTQGVDADKVLKMWGLNERPEEFVLESLVGEKVMKSAARSIGTSIHTEVVQAKLSDPYFVYQNLRGLVPDHALRGGSIDVVALERNLKRLGISPQEFDEYLEDALLRSFLFSLVEAGLYIPNEALKNAYIGQNVKKKYAYLPLTRSSYVSKAKEKKLTDAEVSSYYTKKENQEQYRIPEKRSAKVWTFSPESFGLVVNDAELKTAYNRNKHSYVKVPEKAKIQHILLKFTKDNKTDVRTKAQEIYNQVKAAPDTFAAVAAENSASADKGTTITVERSGKNRALATLAFSLTKDGISAVRETPDGFEVVKLIERIKPVYKTLDQVKPELLKKLKKEKFERMFNSNAQRVVSQSRQAPGFLTKFIEEHKGQLSTVKDVTQDEKQQNQAIFRLRKVGDTSFYQEGGNGYILELTTLTASEIPPLGSVKTNVTEDMYKERALELLKKDLEQGLTDIRSGKKTLAQVAQSLSGTVDITDWIVFKDKDSLKKLETMKLNLTKVAQLTKQGDAATDITDTHGYIIQVKQIDKFKPEEFEKDKGRLRMALARKEGQGLSAAFVQSLRDKANISLNEQLLRHSR